MSMPVKNYPKKKGRRRRGYEGKGGKEKRREWRNRDREMYTYACVFSCLCMHARVCHVHVDVRMCVSACMQGYCMYM